MGWINLLWLTIGLGLGWVGCSLLRPTTSPTDSSTLKDAGQRQSDFLLSSTSAPSEPNPEDLAALAERLHRTQLAYHMATEMSQFKGGFLARISHELRAPLNGLIGLHQLILADLCDNADEERQFVGQAHTAALKLVKLIDEILDVSRIESGRDRLEIKPLNLAEILEAVHRLTHLQAANRNLKLQILPPESAVYVLADARWLRQVLVNLVDTSIALMADVGEGYVRLSVKVVPAVGQAKILIEDQRPAGGWAEPLALMQDRGGAKNQDETKASLLAIAAQATEQLPERVNHLSPGLTLALNQTILECMQGRLDVLVVPTVEDSSPSAVSQSVDGAAEFTQLQCSLPLALTAIASPESATEP